MPARLHRRGPGPRTQCLRHAAMKEKLRDRSRCLAPESPPGPAEQNAFEDTVRYPHWRQTRKATVSFNLAPFSEKQKSLSEQTIAGAVEAGLMRTSALESNSESASHQRQADLVAGDETVECLAHMYFVGEKNAAGGHFLPRRIEFERHIPGCVQAVMKEHVRNGQVTQKAWQKIAGAST